MIASRRLAPLLLLLAGLAVLTLAVALTVHAQSQEVTATAAATGANPPAKPTSLQASAGHDSVTLTWMASTDQTVTHYAILRRNRDTDASQVFHVVESNAGPETSYTDGTVSASSTYIYRAKAVSRTGVSQWSGYVKAETPAAPDSTLEPTPIPTPTPSPEPVPTPAPEDLAPTGLTVSLVGNKVTLSWTAPHEDAESVDGYEILRRRPYEGESSLATLVADTESTATTYTDATATGAGETYAYQVKAIRGEDRSDASGQAQVQVPHDPVDLAPTGLTAVVLTASLVLVGEDPTTTASTSVRLSWTAPAEDAGSVTGYEILRAVGEGELATLVDDTGNTATAYTDTTATEAGETYAYEVKAIRGEDRSQASGQARVQLPHDAVDLAPSDLTAEAVDGGGVDLSWSAPAKDADRVTGYEVLRAVGQGQLTTLPANSASVATSYIDAGATQAGETYRYEVKALRGAEKSRASNRAALRLPPDPVDQSEPKGISDQTDTPDSNTQPTLEAFPSSQGAVYTWDDGDRTLQARLQVDLTVTKDGGISSRETIVRSDIGSDTAQKSGGFPVFRSPSGALMTLPGGVLLVFDAAWDQAAVDDFFVRNQIGVSRVSELGWLPNGFFVDTEPGFPSLDLANALTGQDGVVLSSPNWWTESTLY